MLKNPDRHALIVPFRFLIWVPIATGYWARDARSRTSGRKSSRLTLTAA